MAACAIDADVAPEAPTVKGFVSLLVDIFSGATPEPSVWPSTPIWCSRFGLAEALGMVRMRGLHAIAQHIRRKSRGRGGVNLEIRRQHSLAHARRCRE